MKAKTSTWIYISCIITIVLITIFVIISLRFSIIKTNNILKENEEYVNKIDSLNTVINYQYYLLENAVEIEKYDSINALYEDYKNRVDSIEEENMIYKIKLDRIKEYNRIAAKGNNITFLRGWINRVLNE